MAIARRGGLERVPQKGVCEGHRLDCIGETASTLAHALAAQSRGIFPDVRCP